MGRLQGVRGFALSEKDHGLPPEQTLSRMGHDCCFLADFSTVLLSLRESDSAGFDLASTPTPWHSIKPLAFVQSVVSNPKRDRPAIPWLIVSRRSAYRSVFFAGPNRPG
jgi:hypothetical protein